MIRFVVLTALLSTAVAAQSVVPGVTLAATEQRTITSEKIGQRYDLLVSLPNDYRTSGKAYPVLYVLDGWHFPLMAFLQNNNIYSERMRPVIIVNISHGDVGAMAARARDFTPTSTNQEPGSGGAGAFLDFLEHDVIPFVDRTYRTVPTDRALLGHSYRRVVRALHARAASVAVSTDRRRQSGNRLGSPRTLRRPRPPRTSAHACAPRPIGGRRRVVARGQRGVRTAAGSTQTHRPELSFYDLSG